MDIKFQMGKTTNDPAEQSPKAEPGQDLAGERTKQVTVAGWTVGLAALFMCIALSQSPTWPMAFGIAAVAAMVAVVCYYIVKKA
jgi:dipeptide/tripeptide permease